MSNPRILSNYKNPERFGRLVNRFDVSSLVAGLLDQSEQRETLHDKELCILSALDGPGRKRVWGHGLGCMV